MRQTSLLNSRRSQPVRKLHKRKIRKIVVGTKGYLHIGDSITTVRVIEDRGPVGWRGKHLLRVQLLDETVTEPIDFEVPEVDLLLTKPRVKTRTANKILSKT